VEKRRSRRKGGSRRKNTKPAKGVNKRASIHDRRRQALGREIRNGATLIYQGRTQGPPEKKAAKKKKPRGPPGVYLIGPSERGWL